MSNPVISEKVQDNKVARAKVLLVEDDSLQAGITKSLLHGIGAIKPCKTEDPDICPSVDLDPLFS